MFKKLLISTACLSIGFGAVSQGIEPALPNPNFFYEFNGNFNNTGSSAASLANGNTNVDFVANRNSTSLALSGKGFSRFTSSIYPTGNSSKTISCWIKFNTKKAQNVYSFGVGEARKTFALQLDATGVLKFSNFENNFTSTFSPVAEKWYYITTTYSQSTGFAKLYVDGVLEYTSTLMAQEVPNATQGSTTNFYIGSISGVQTSLDATIDDFGIYNTELTSDEISKLFFSYVPKPTLDNIVAVRSNATEAIITAKVNPKGAVTTVEIKYGSTATSLNLTFTVTNDVNGNSEQNINTELVNLSSETIYYQIVATNGAGSVSSSVLRLLPFGSLPDPEFYYALNNDFINSGTATINSSNNLNNNYVNDRNNVALKALKYSGISSRVNSQSFAIGNSDRTVSLWIKFHSIAAQNIFSFGKGTATNCFALQMDATGVLKFSNYQNNFNSTFTPTVDEWYFITATYEKATGFARLYINGDLKYTSINMPVNILSDPNNFYLGSIVGVQTAINATLDEVKIYNSLFSTNQVLKSFNAENVTTSDVENNLTRNFVIYPNPAQNALTVPEFAQVFDLLGNKVAEGENSIDLSKLNKGVYFVKIKNETIKLIKE